MCGTSFNWENLSIYYANLSPVYLISCLFTVLAIFSSWWFRNTYNDTNVSKLLAKSAPQTDREKPIPPKHSRTSEEDEIEAEARRLIAKKCTNEHGLMRHVKSARQSAIEKQLTAGLSEEQLQKERETQASQLAAIYKLLKEKEDQFQIKSMDELQEQLKLYRS